MVNGDHRAALDGDKLKMAKATRRTEFASWVCLFDTLTPTPTAKPTANRTSREMAKECVRSLVPNDIMYPNGRRRTKRTGRWIEAETSDLKSN